MSNIRRKPRDRNYSTIPNNVLEDERLTWAARGLLAFVLSKPDDWTVRKTHLIKSAPGGERAMRPILKALKDFGYMRDVAIKDPATGKITGWETEVSEFGDLERNTSAAVSHTLVSGQGTSAAVSHSVDNAQRGKQPPLVSTDLLLSTERTPSTEKMLAAKKKIDPLQAIEDHLAATEDYRERLQEWDEALFRIKMNGTATEEQVRSHLAAKPCVPRLDPDIDRKLGRKFPDLDSLDSALKDSYRRRELTVLLTS